ncbi:helix-turn-helix domain-containing protein [Nocardia carnea]|uniref:helix-turn-helix domain-containing protein n=1 Tax=Nocardia carnea TaxID=37328 RepID=UPI002456049A|nr:helix-turn-helix transcriptional regulator [Nocardia carnea]
METEKFQHHDEKGGRVLGARLCELRAQLGLTQWQFGRMLQWDPSRVSRMETGRAIPTDADIEQWCDAVGAQTEIAGLQRLAHTTLAARRDQLRRARGYGTTGTAMLLLTGWLCSGWATAPAAAHPATATADCRQAAVGAVISGTGRGDTLSGPGAIFAFEYAYYQQRSGQAAREVVAADASVPSAEQIQRGIDSLPPDTRYCVEIDTTTVTAGPDYQQWTVTVTQQRPGQDPRPNTQLITTAHDTTGCTVITAIAPA